MSLSRFDAFSEAGAAFAGVRGGGDEFKTLIFLSEPPGDALHMLFDLFDQRRILAFQSVTGRPDELAKFGEPLAVGHGLHKQRFRIQVVQGHRCCLFDFGWCRTVELVKGQGVIVVESAIFHASFLDELHANAFIFWVDGTNIA